MDHKHESTHDCSYDHNGLVCVHCDVSLLTEQQLEMFAGWLDQELADLEERFAEFVTHSSLRNFIGR